MLKRIKSKLEEAPHLKEIVKGGSTFFIFRLLGMIVGYVFTLLVTRKLGASAWGAFTLSLTLLQISSLLSCLGLDSALLRFIAQYNAQGKGRTAFFIYPKPRAGYADGEDSFVNAASGNLDTLNLLLAVNIPRPLFSTIRARA